MTQEQQQTFYLELEREGGILHSGLTLYLLNKPTANQLHVGRIREFLKTGRTIFPVLVRGFSDELKIGTTFDTLVQLNDLNCAAFKPAVMRYVSVNAGYEVDHLPKGYFGLAVLEFPDGLPDLLQKLAIDGTRKDPWKHATLLLTQKEVFDGMCKVWEELQKEN